MDKKLYEKMKVLDIVENWGLNKISDKQLTVTAKLASGGQGKVKLGKYYDMKVIIKVLHDLNARDYTNEVINAFKYRHPNIPKFLGVYDSEKDFGAVFEHVDGMTLSKIISLEREGSLKLPFILKIDYMIQLASVIEFLHDNHLIHRDLKPGNIIIDHLGNLNLLDFGIAIPESKCEIDMDTHDYCLTPNYIPPEIAIQSRDLGAEEDQEEEEADSKQDYKSESNKTLLNLSEDKSITNSSTMTSFTYTNRIQKTPKRKIIMVTNKYDVWTFGLIMAELFTRCPPWGGKPKDKFPDYKILTFIYKNKPYPISTIYPEGSEGEEGIREIIKKSTIYSEKNRPSIKEIKQELLKVFKKEVEISAKEIKFHVIKNLNTVHRDLRQTFDKSINADSKRSLMRMNKMMYNRKNFNLDAINQVNLKLNVNSFGNFSLDTHSSSDFKIIFSEHMKHLALISSTNNDSKNIVEIDNSLMEGLKKINLQKGQTLKIMEHKKREVLSKLEELNKKWGYRNKMIGDAEGCGKNSACTNASFLKSYYFMTFDEFNQQILIYEFPKKEMKKVNFALINKNYNYRNPFCLNFDEKLLMIGGLIINSGINSNKLKKNDITHRNTLVNFRREYYSEIFGTNYSPTNNCFYFDPNKKEQKALPLLLYPRMNHSCIIFRKSSLWVIGGTTKACEVLDVRNISNAKFDGCSFKVVADLIYEVMNPILIHYNDNFILALEYDYDNMLAESSIKFQVFDYDTRCWTADSVVFDTQKFNLDIEYFFGFYHNPDEQNKLCIFANCYDMVDDIEDDDVNGCFILEENENKEQETHEDEDKNIIIDGDSVRSDINEEKQKEKKKIKVKKSILLNFKINFYGDNLNDESIKESTLESNADSDSPPFDFVLQSFSDYNHIQKKISKDFSKVNLLQEELLLLHNSNTLYEFDDEYYYYTLDLKEKNIVLRSMENE